MDQTYELIIIGGGPAGLSGALLAGRARRRALLIDGGTPRNAAAPAMHSFVSRDGILPRDFRAAAHRELERYRTVFRKEAQVRSMRSHADAQTVILEDGSELTARFVLLAVGLVDTLPEIPGLRTNWGKGVHHCPFCDGFEHRDGRWGILAEEPPMREHALLLRGWTQDITVLTNASEIAEAELAMLRDAGLRVVTDSIAEVMSGDGHTLGGVRLASGIHEAIGSLWIRPAQNQTQLIQSLGLDLRDDGAIQRDERGQTSRPGLFAAGDCAAGPMQQAILSAADGARTTFSIVRELIRSFP
jgi:thioredoxin reductase